jgi:single-strand DNA-binding protein
MFNEAQISLSGYVATQPALRETRSGIPSVSMRVAWTPRRMDRASGEWIDAGTSFATVQLYRKLAENAATCLRKGDPVVVRGRVSVREFETRNGQQRTVVEIDATSVGHDLSHGIATFHRVRPQTGMTAAEFRAAEETGPSGAADSPAAAGAAGDSLPGAGVAGDGVAGDELEPAGLEPDGPAGPDSREPQPSGEADPESAGPDDGQQQAGGDPGPGRGKAGGRAGARERALAQV